MIAPSSPPRIFISYARSDGEDFARLLRRRLIEEYGFAVWQDRTEMQVGEGWWQQIVAALTSEHVEHMVLVMTPAAMDSKMVRKEWRLARQEGVCVLPVIAAPDLDFQSLPHWMGAVHFTDPDTPEEWARFIRTLEGPCQEKRVPFMVEDLPEDFVQRSYEFDKIVSCLLDCEHEGAIAITAALRGAGGYGKTTLAKALCHDERILEAFYDGILWVTLGENPGDLTGRVEDLIEILIGERSGFAGLDAATSRLAESLADRHILIVIDDVWNRVHLKPFVQGGPLCARLITTRDSSSLPESAARILVDAMQKDEAVELLKTGLPSAEGEALQRLAADLGEWPLLLKLVNSALREHVSLGLDVNQALAYVNEDLSELGLTAFDAEDPQARDQAAAATLGLSLKHLNEDERARFGELAIFPEDVGIPQSILEQLWGMTGSLKPVHIRRLSQKLYQRLSLLQTYDAANQTIRLHDVVRKYLIEEEGTKLPSIHEQFLDSYGLVRWIDLPASESYLWDHLAYHLVEAGREEELRRLLLDFDWLQAKLAATDANSLIADYDFLSVDQELRLVQGAIRLSAHVLARDGTELSGQLLGRLQSFQGYEIQSMLEQARGWRGGAWLCPLTASLMPPGGSLIRTLVGHAGWVRAVAVMPDGKHAISGSGDGTLKMWDIESGKELRTLKGHTRSVSAVAVTPDGKRAISGSKDNTLKVWDLESGKESRALVGHDGWVRAVAVTIDGRYVISGSSDNTIKVWDIESGEEMRTIKGHADTVKVVAVTIDGRYVISGSSDNTIKVWDIESGEELRTLKGHTDSVWAVAVTNNGKHAISGSKDSTLKVWDIESGEELLTLEGHTYDVKAVAVMPDGRYLISGSSDNTLKVWDIESGKELRTLKGHTNQVRAVAVTPDGKHAISGSIDGTLKVWDFDNEGELLTLDGHAGWVRAVAVMPDGRYLISGSSDNTLKVWDIESGKELRTLKGHTNEVRAVAVTPDGKHAISGSKDGTLEIWDIESGKELRALDGHINCVRTVAVTPDGKHAISGSSDTTIKVWDIESGEELLTLEGHTDDVKAVAVTPDGKHVISGSLGNPIKVWDIETGEELRALIGHANSVLAVAVTSDGKHVISGSIDNTLKVWDLESGEELRTLGGHVEWVRAVAVTPDGKHVISGSSDNTLKIWDLESGEVIVSFSGDSDFLSCAVSPDGRTIAAGDASGRVHFLQLMGA